MPHVVDHLVVQQRVGVLAPQEVQMVPGRERHLVNHAGDSVRETLHHLQQVLGRREPVIVAVVEGGRGRNVGQLVPGSLSLHHYSGNVVEIIIS